MHPIPVPPPSSSSSIAPHDRVILRVGSRNSSRPGSSAGANLIQQMQQHQHQQSHQQGGGYHTVSTYNNSTSNAPIYQPYGYSSQMYAAPSPPPRTDSTASLPAANEIYTITRGNGFTQGHSNGLQHSSSAIVTSYDAYQSTPPSSSSSTSATSSFAFSASASSSTHPNSTSRPTSSHMSRVGSTKSLPLAVALGNDIHLPASTLSPVGSMKAITPTNAASSSASSSATSASSSSSLHAPASSSIVIPSVLSPAHQIDVPLIKWSELSLAESGTVVEKTKAIKNEFHTNLKNFLKQAKSNIEEMAMELFHEEDDEDDADDDADGNVGEGDVKTTARGSPVKSAPIPGLVTSTVLSNANAKQLGSPRKAALLQQLVQLSSQMDAGLAQIQAVKEADLKKSKQGQPSSSTAPRFNKNDIAQLAALARDDPQDSVVSSSPSKSFVSTYPSSVSSSSTAALKAFVRRSQLGERHRAYEQWVASKEAAQEKAIAKKAKEEKLERLRELQEQRRQQSDRAEQERLTQLELDRVREEEDQLRRELEAQRRAEEAERREREAYEQGERDRLERERQEREELRRQHREAEQARARFEEELRRREAEDRAWEDEKRARELAENEAKRMTEELKAQVAKDLALVSGGGGNGVDNGTNDVQDQAELDALFEAASRSTVDPDPSASASDGPDTDEEFAEFGSPRAEAEVRASKVAAKRANATTTAAANTSSNVGSLSARLANAATAPSTALAGGGRKARTVARTTGNSNYSALPPNFPQAPSLPVSVQGSPRTTVKPMSFGSTNTQPVTSSTNYRFERAKRMAGR